MVTGGLCNILYKNEYQTNIKQKDDYLQMTLVWMCKAYLAFLHKSIYGIPYS